MRKLNDFQKFIFFLESSDLKIFKILFENVKRKIFLKRIVGCNSKRRNMARRPIKVTKLSLSNGTQV